MRRLCASMLLLALAACAPSSSHSSGDGSLASAATVTTSVVPTSVAPAASATSSSPSTAVVTSTDLARHHAPLFKFNAWVQGSSSINDKSEDYFPMSVRGFFAELASHKARVITKGASGPNVGVSQIANV